MSLIAISKINVKDIPQRRERKREKEITLDGEVSIIKWNDVIRNQNNYTKIVDKGQYVLINEKLRIRL